MIRQPITLTPNEVRVLISCPLHYHFLQQKPAGPKQLSPQAELDLAILETIQQLHAAGGPARMALPDLLKKLSDYPQAQQIVEVYYYRLEHDWPRLMAGNETLTLRISLGGVPLVLRATVDRLDKTRDGGILAILFCPAQGPPPEPAQLRADPAITIYHALVASAYPLKRPVRIQQLWLRSNQDVTIELSEDEYRQNLARLRQPVQGLARSEVMARPGLHCDVCPFKHRGCPVYAHEPDAETEPEDLGPALSDGKISPRKWIFKI